MRPGKRRRPRIGIGLVLGLLCALVLAACGADVNSQLELEEDLSGERTFVMTMADSDVDALVGGVDAAEQALALHAPQVLVFDGIEQREEGYSATFTLHFQDLDDYQNKIRSLLDASEVPAAERNMSIKIDEQKLVRTMSVEESFYNDDLMGWAAEALVTEGVVANNATVLTSSGSATVQFQGEAVDTATSLPRMNFTVIDDRRFEDVGLNVEFLESGEFQITMDYLVSAEAAEAQNNFLTQLVGELQELEGVAEPLTDTGAASPGDGNDARSITVQFSNPEALSSGMQLLLANDTASFEVKEVSNNDSPDVVTQFVGSNWSCEAICDPNNLQQLDGETTYPEHWQVVDERHGDGEFFVEFNREMPLQEMTASTRLDFDGSMEQTLEFVVDNATQEGHEDRVAEKFAPPPNTGSFHTAVQDSMTVYTTTLRAQDGRELTNMINAYLDAKGVDTQASIDHGPLNGIWASYDLHIDLSPIWEVATGGVENTTSFSVELPTMHSGHSDDSASNERVINIEDSTGTFTVHANGPTVTTIWVAGITLLFLVVIIVLLFRTHKAATRVWGIANVDPEGPKPYHVQGPKDELTESQIFEAPLANGSHSHWASTAAISPPFEHEDTKSFGTTGPFPDVPVPSHAQYQDLQQRLRQKGEKTESPAPKRETDAQDDSMSKNSTDEKSDES